MEPRKIFLKTPTGVLLFLNCEDYDPSTVKET